MRKRFKILLIALLPIQIIAVKWTGSHPLFIEKHYSNGLYPILSEAQRWLLGWIPFSTGDLLYAIIAILLIINLFKLIKSKFSNPKKWISSLLAYASILYFLFHLLWGMNYYRLPLHQKLQIDASYSLEELTDFTRTLVLKTNAAHQEITPNPEERIDFEFEKDFYKQTSIYSYGLQNNNHNNINFYFNSIKPSLFSYFLTYMGFSGYLNPFTNEAQYNYLVPGFKQPTLVTHEMAHQVGYAKENEANFIAALVCIDNPDPYFNYSGYAFALSHCLSTIHRQNPDLSKEIMEDLNPGIRKNFKEINDFWAAYENPTEPLFKAFYSRFLKINNQPDGMETYNYVVALLVNYYQGDRCLD